LRLIPRDERFYEMFEELAKRLTATARLINQLFAEPERLEVHVASIKALEHEADNLTHEIIARINRSFVTPIDREDIHLLASQLDDVIDSLDGTARRAAMFHITEVRRPAIQLAEVLMRAAECVARAINGMTDPKIVNARSRELKLLEEEGDAIYHQAVGTLFLGTPDPLDVIKWKELYDTLEDALDQCEDVANVLEAISLKHG
jgi:predicted phosphate transport protein (TIGR00153 family)